MFEGMKKEKIMEASLSRIWRDYQDNEFGIITAWRFECDDEKGKLVNNKQNLSALKSGVRGGGFGYVRIDGVGQEECGGKVISVKEPALLVKNVKSGGEPVMDSDKFDNFLIRLGRKYNQWGIVLHSPEKGSRLIALKNRLDILPVYIKSNANEVLSEAINKRTKNLKIQIEIGKIIEYKNKLPLEQNYKTIFNIK